MIAYRKGNGKIKELFGYGIIADDVIKNNGYQKVDVLDIENYKDIQWEGIEFNRLFMKNNVLYRFNEWNVLYPYKSLNIQEIGLISE
uniref:hypothetical protein n=1 Tax=Clostridium sp. 12(A) TaxID=1163671 RepID=UPI0004632EE7|nr:hypothetical protein [Clostridium sp. 12(A)]